MPPSVTLSWRIGRVTSETLDSGSTFSVSTSFSCSIQAKIPDSSPANGASSSSGTFRRASRAMRATVSLSSDIQNSQRSIGGVVADAGPAVQWLQCLGQEDAAGARRIARNLAENLPAMAFVDFRRLETDRVEN